MDVQTIGVLVTAVSVSIAAAYYVINLRETTKNRRITLTTTMMQPFMTEEGVKHFIDLLNMDWTDLEDFSKRYDSRVNPENFAKRQSMWNLCENLGSLYRDGLIDIKTLYDSSRGVIPYMWIKFKPVIEMFRRTDYGPRSYENFEYISGKLIDYEKKLTQDSVLEKRLEKIIAEHAKTP